MDQPFSAAPHHDILVLLIQVALLLFTARVFGEIAQRRGQPSVVGEILAGIVLGPSLLSGLFPVLGEWIVPHNEVQGYLLELMSLIGVMFLLLITGLETDLALIRQQARSAIGIALGGLLLPLALGFTLGELLPDEFLIDSDDRLVFSLFVAIAFAISAIPVVAKVLMDLQLTRRDIGQSMIAAAMIDDTVGWVLLSIVIGLASGSAITLASVGQSVFVVLAFIGLSLTLGRLLIGRIITYTQDNIQMSDKMLTLVVVMMFVWGAIGQALGIEAILGAFVVGIVLSQIPRLSPDTIHRVESIALGIFAPVFFAVAGLKVDAERLLEPTLIGVTLVVIVVAVTSKMVGVYIGSRLIGGSDHWSAVFYGAGLNARGSIGIIVADIGLTLGILSQDMFSIIVVMAVVTSLVSPAMMKYAQRHVKPQQQEMERLRREELNESNVIANVRRVLLPVRLRENVSPSQRLESQIIEHINTSGNIALTLMSVANADERARCSRYLDQLAELFTPQSIIKKIASGDDPQATILEEAKRGYDLMILGASEKQNTSEVLFTPLVDFLIRTAPCPTMLVQGHYVREDWTLSHVLVPSNGSQASRRAVEVAFTLANDAMQVTILQVVEENRSDYRLDARGILLERQKTIAQNKVERLRELGEFYGVNANALVKVGLDPEVVILETARREKVDLIILGTNISTGSDHLYLGPRVERILSNASCPVIVFNT